MNATAATANSAPGQAPASTPWDLWLRQLQGILRLELRKNIFSARALPMYLLAGLPIFLLGCVVILPVFSHLRANVHASQFFAVLYNGYFMVALFISSLFLFTQLFRGDLMDRSLHYYFLCPVRRELLVAAKFAAGLVSSALVLSTSALISYLLVALNFEQGPQPGTLVGHALAYTGITALGCLGYGSLFMLAGLYFKNPVIAPFSLFLWEFINPFLPAVLKKISVLHYLVSLLPVRPSSSNFFEILIEPTSPWLSVPGLLLVSAVALLLAARKIRRTEITYAED